MVDDLGKLHTVDSGFVVRLLVDQTGVTNAQALELIAFLGLN